MRLAYIAALTASVFAAALLSGQLAVILALGPTVYSLALSSSDMEVSAREIFALYNRETAA